MKRPEFNRLPADIFHSKVRCVVLWMLDRLSRRIKDGVMTLADWSERQEFFSLPRSHGRWATGSEANGRPPSADFAHVEWAFPEEKAGCGAEGCPESSMSDLDASRDRDIEVQPALRFPKFSLIPRLLRIHSEGDQTASAFRSAWASSRAGVLASSTAKSREAKMPSRCAS
jgi:hypothetical protein